MEREKTTYVRGVGSPIRHRPTSSLPRTIIRSTRVWCLRSTQPPLFTSTISARVASSPISSGATPAFETASAQCIAEVVDSARRLRAYPGDLMERKGSTCVPRIDDLQNLLATFVTLVHVGVKIYIGNVSVEDGARCFNHTVRELGIHPHSVSGYVMLMSSVSIIIQGERLTLLPVFA